MSRRSPRQPRALRCAHGGQQRPADVGWSIAGEGGLLHVDTRRRLLARPRRSSSARRASRRRRRRGRPLADGASWLGEDMPLPLAVKHAAGSRGQVGGREAVPHLQSARRRQDGLGRRRFRDRGDEVGEPLALSPGSNPDIERRESARQRGPRSRRRSTRPSWRPRRPSAAGRRCRRLPRPCLTPRRQSRTSTVSGTIRRRRRGTGGAVVWLKRANGETPRPRPAKGKVISQRGKQFRAARAGGSGRHKVNFRNEDTILPQRFLALQAERVQHRAVQAGRRPNERPSSIPGAVQLLCNIHASMLGYVVRRRHAVLRAGRGAGAFTIRGVPPGEYELEDLGRGGFAGARRIERLCVGADGLHGSSRCASAANAAPRVRARQIGQAAPVAPRVLRPAQVVARYPTAARAADSSWSRCSGRGEMAPSTNPEPLGLDHAAHRVSTASRPPYSSSDGLNDRPWASAVVQETRSRTC